MDRASAMPSVMNTFSPVFFLLSLLIATLPNGVNGRIGVSVNSFEVNLSRDTHHAKEKTSQFTDFSPPSSAKSSYKWTSRSYGPCFGCGSKSYKTLTHDCIHRIPMQLSVGSYSKSLMGVFKVPDSECTSRGIQSPSSVTTFACGPPCSELRLLRGENTGCRCDHERKQAYDVPDLICQNNRNKTVSLSLCKFFYEKNPLDYQVTVCDYSIVCSRQIIWITGNWSACGEDSSVHQMRKIICVAQAPEQLGIREIYYRMHESMCAEQSTPTKLQLCARWTAERSFRCVCATKTATRRVICVRGKQRIYDEEECSWHAKPNTTRACTEKQIQECAAPLATLKVF